MDSNSEKAVPYWNIKSDPGQDIGPNLRRPSEIEKTTMSVREMGRLLGLKKTDSYWLLHKDFFKTYTVNNQTRIDIADFERWYAGQIKYHKVDGTPPGEQLRKESYSAKDIAEILELSEATAYELITRENMETITVNYWKRVPKEAFDKWYASQKRYRNAEDREKDRKAEENSIWQADMARMLGISRESAYYLIKKNYEEGLFDIVVIGGKKRITKASFYHWYESQTNYRLLTEEEMAAAEAAREKKLREKKQSRLPPKAKQMTLKEPKNPKYYTMDEIVEFYGLSRSTVRYWLKNGSIPGIMVGKSWRIPREEFDDWLDYKNC